MTRIQLFPQTNHSRYRLQQSYQRSSLVKQLVNSSTHCNLSYLPIIFMRITGSRLGSRSLKAEVNLLAAEQSNSLLTIGDVAMLKMYRRISAGQHPETEMNRYLTSQGFAHAPALLGDVVHVAADGAQATLAIALQFVRNEGDAWSWMLDHLTRALDAQAPAEPVAGSGADLLADCDAIAAAIGRRLGEMHAILARETSNSAFSPKTAADGDAAGWVKKTEQRVQKAVEAIAGVQTWQREQDQERAQELMNRQTTIAAAVRALAESGAGPRLPSRRNQGRCPATVRRESRRAARTHRCERTVRRACRRLRTLSAADSLAASDSGN